MYQLFKLANMVLIIIFFLILQFFTIQVPLLEAVPCNTSRVKSTNIMVNMLYWSYGVYA